MDRDATDMEMAGRKAQEDYNGEAQDLYVVKQSLYGMATLLSPKDSIIKNITGRLFILYLDHVTSELQKQVLDCSSCFIALYLMPNKLHLLANEETVMALYDAYKVYLFNLEHFKAELQRWCEKWIDVSRDEQPNSILSTLQELTPASYPDLNVVCFCHPANQSLSRKKTFMGTADSQEMAK